MFRDLRHSLRALVRNPAFSLAAIAALTLGIGANTAIFSVVNAVLLRPVALPDPDRMVIFMSVAPQGTNYASSPAKFAHFATQTDIADHVSAFRLGTINFTGGTFPEQLQWGQVSAEFFALIGAKTLLGRTFTADEDRPNGAKTAVLSAGLWRTRFQSDPHAVGRAISLSGEPYTIIGVLDEFDFREFGPTPQVWTAFQLDPNTTDQGHYFQTAGASSPA